MDLLTGYGSGSESETEGNAANPILSSRIAVLAAPAATGTAAAAAKPSLFCSLPGPKHAAEAVGTAGSELPPGFFDSPAAAPPTRSSAAASGMPSSFHAAPSSRAAQDLAAGDADDADELAPGPAARPPPAAVADLPQPSDPQLWSKLPAANKRKVSLRPKIDMALLAASDSDNDDAAPAAKKARPAAAAAGKPSILSFLPAPKHAPKGPKGGGSGMLGGGTRLDTAMGSSGQQQQQQQQDAGDAGQQAAPSSAAVSNEAYRMRPAAAAAAPAAAADGHGGSGSYQYAGQYEQQQHEQHQYHQRHAAAGRAGAVAAYGYSTDYHNSAATPAAAGTARPAAAAAAAAAMHPEEALLQEALQAEAAKAARRGAGAGSSQLVLPDIQFKEVKADSIKYVDPAQREAAQGMRAALGSDYAAKLRSEAAPHAGSKLARSKHQIGTLFANAKLRELEVLENRAAGMKSKAETAGKYGWR